MFSFCCDNCGNRVDRVFRAVKLKGDPFGIGLGGFRCRQRIEPADVALHQDMAISA